MNGATEQLTLQIGLDDSSTFENFYIAGSNSQALGYLYDQHSSQLEQFTYLWGNTGSGRSHLLQAVCHHFDGRDAASFYLPLSQFADYAPEILDGLENLALVCLDDLQSIVGNQAWEFALFSLFNRLRESHTRLVVAANCAPRELPIVLPDLLSRLQSGVVFQLQALRDEEKRFALQLRATQRGIALSEEVLNYVLQRNDRSMQALFMLLEQLDQFSLQTKRRITVPLLRELMDRSYSAN